MELLKLTTASNCPGTLLTSGVASSRLCRMSGARTKFKLSNPLTLQAVMAS